MVAASVQKCLENMVIVGEQKCLKSTSAARMQKWLESAVTAGKQQVLRGFNSFQRAEMVIVQQGNGSSARCPARKVCCEKKTNILEKYPW